MGDRMTMPARSYENFGAGQQLYRVIEVCTDPETLYAKIESAQWDWLGVQENGNRPKFLLGRPARGHTGGAISATATMEGAEAHQYGVQVSTPKPYGMPPNAAWYLDAEQARRDYARQQKELREGSGSGLYRLSLIIDGKVADEDFIVRALPNRL